MALMFEPYFEGGVDDIFPIRRIERNILNECDCPGEYYDNHHTQE
jgi:hypothetical protein